MAIRLAKTHSKDKQKIYYKIEFGREAGQRISTGIYTYANPKNEIEKDYNKQALEILEMKKAQMILEHQSIATGFIPKHKLMNNFFDYYEQFVKENRRADNRHLECSLNALRKFYGKRVLAPIDITEHFTQRFRQYLLDKYNGETPMNYFGRFKRVLKVATKAGYFRINPSMDVKAKPNRNVIIKEIIEKEEYQKLMTTPCTNREVQKAFIFSLYTGLRWSDIKSMKWDAIRDNTKTFRIHQNKTGVPLERPLHNVARSILGERQQGLVFCLPTQDGANKILNAWVKNAGVNKHISWHCARHSFAVLLQDNGVDTATVAGMRGHTSTKFVHKTYQRYRSVKAFEAIEKLPDYTAV
jgi:integrase/recombinase XerD